MLEKLRKEYDTLEEEYVRTHDAETWADLLDLSIRIARMEKE